ncbi:hypothetical protein VNO77_24852 [Canavalia gladiata]|uniref:Uncharacterized protein n=1 Tax=Canavalia gladiata TaxID=3824 RepID=A0AAN9LAH1_CANGL
MDTVPDSVMCASTRDLMDVGTLSNQIILAFTVSEILECGYRVAHVYTSPSPTETVPVAIAMIETGQKDLSEPFVNWLAW